MLYVGAALWQRSHNKPAVLAVEVDTGRVVWTTVMDAQPGNGGVRGVLVDGERVIGTGYVNCPEPGFQFVADDGKAVVWELDMDGNLVAERLISEEVEEEGGVALGQGAKIRRARDGGYVVGSTGWGEVGGDELNVVVVVKMSAGLEVEWSRSFGLEGGHSQMFDMVVDEEGDFLLAGHTTVGDDREVVNWDYLALKVGRDGEMLWRRTFGQPRGFDARYIVE